ncbi:MAG TPA: hypothetical protein VGY54_17055, partial [Polyangiaceae bacterium]|nr:hypothetical protein [Polyangiaceae bacterium]
MAGVRLLWISAFLAAAAGCSKTVPSGGLVVVLRNDRTLQPEPDTLHVEVGPADGGAPSYKSANYSLADATTADKHAFPVSFAIESNGDPGASVSFIASVSNGSQPLETFDYVVDSIPTDYVVELDVVFRAACAAQASINGETVQASCCPAELLCNWTNGTCHCSAHRLPVYPADAGELGHGDGTDSGSMDMADSDSSDGAAVEDSGASGTGHDGSIDSSLGGGNDTGAAFDASACEIGAVRCSDYLTPQQCTPDGGWTSLTGCAQGSTYCLDGRCIATPTSCKSVTDYVGCDSYLVPGGTFLRGNDPLHDAGAAATISAFRLDAFEVPLWRFRQFVTAVIGGDSNVPSDLAEHGLHAHLPGG